MNSITDLHFFRYVCNRDLIKNKVTIYTYGVNQAILETNNVVINRIKMRKTICKLTYSCQQLPEYIVFASTRQQVLTQRGRRSATSGVASLAGEDKYSKIIFSRWYWIYTVYISDCHIYMGKKLNLVLNLYIIQLEFPSTWSCVSLRRNPKLQASEWKLFRFGKLEVDYFQILLLDITLYL